MVPSFSFSIFFPNKQIYLEVEKYLHFYKRKKKPIITSLYIHHSIWISIDFILLLQVFSSSKRPDFRVLRFSELEEFEWEKLIVYNYTHTHTHTHTHITIKLGKDKKVAHFSVLIQCFSHFSTWTPWLWR